MKIYRVGEKETVIEETDDETSTKEVEIRPEETNNSPPTDPTLEVRVDQEIEKQVSDLHNEPTDPPIVEQGKTSEKRKRRRPPKAKKANPPTQVSSKVKKQKDKKQTPLPTLRMSLRKTIRPRDILNI